MEKKRFGSLPGYFEPLWGEKSNYGKIGRRRRLSKLNVLFFSIILSVTIYIYISHFQTPSNGPKMSDEFVQFRSDENGWLLPCL